jgi:hypothetical protein
MTVPARWVSSTETAGRSFELSAAEDLSLQFGKATFILPTIAGPIIGTVHEIRRSRAE